MKANLNGKYESWKCWSFGLFVFSKRYGTLVILLGTAWQFGLSRGKTAFGLCIGPVCVGGSNA